MAIFSIVQTRASANLFLIPNAAGCATELTPFGAVNNWECIDDPISTPDYDTKYVYNSSPTLKYDLYPLPNHTTEIGIINYVQIFAMAKSHTYPQHLDGIYKIIVTDNACINIYKSDDKNLTTGYGDYYNLFTENPRTSVAWTWDDIDNLQIGLECNSPTCYYPTNYIFRPDSDIDVNLTAENCPPSHFLCVSDDVPIDTWFKSVRNQSRNPSVWQADTYGLPNHDSVIQRGVITNIRLCWRIAELLPPGESGASSGEVSLIDTVNANSNDTVLSFTYDWTTTYKDYATNPATSVQIKINMLSTSDGETITAIPHCNNLYIIVSYIYDANPEIRTTQCYAKVNYVPPEAECSLNKPEEISVDHSMNIKMLNFWNGTREVYSLNRSGKSMVLTGSEYQSDTCTKTCPCERITCMKEMGKDGSKITISGLRSLFNGEFKIRSFGWKHISKKPELYEWILELEYDD